MIVFPAIDLKAGQCVRLALGDMNQATVFNDNPPEQARDFAAAGADWLHMVDLDGAFAGDNRNAQAIDAILAAVPQMNIQLGGGIRNRETIEAWLEKGVRRVVMGTAALKDPELVKEAAKAHPGRIVVAVDAKDGFVAVEGWAETSDIAVIDLAKRFEGVGVAALLYTDVSRDGMLAGVNVEATKALADATSIAVIASGGL
ncbi:MAG: 1-(5-phosphoribosyl)-5-[(5-phosphoribosylamino)methylideneamino] imidazole-4-carboxamide isomerase, partial [Sphingomonadales bacterium]